MNILHILSQRPDSTGSGIYLQAMLNHGSRQGHHNHVVAAANFDDQPPHTLPGCRETDYILFNTENLPFLIPGMSDVMPYPSSRFSSLTPRQIEHYENIFLEQIRNILDREEIDIIHSHHLWLVSSLVRRNFPDVAMVTSCHGSDLRQFNLCPHLQPQVLAGCRNINRVLALSTMQKEEIENKYLLKADKIDVVGAGFNEDIFFPGSLVNDQDIQIVYCGKLSRAKGVPYLLRAFAQLPHLACHLHLVGEGTGQEREECHHLARLLNDRVTIHGALPQPQLADLLRKSHLFILPSLYEGLPLVLLEAMACNCRVIVTTLPGCLELSQNLSPDDITLIPLPRLEQTDKVVADEEQSFIANIGDSISQAVTHFCHTSQIKSLQSGAVGAFSWQQVYRRVESSYTAALMRKR